MSTTIELKKGNLVRFKNDKYLIEDIGSVGNRTDVELSLFGEWIRHDLMCKIEQIEFIPLNKGIFNHLGFTSFNDDKGYQYFHYPNHNDFFITEFRSLYKFHVRSSAKVFYVHELQNKIKQLTDEDLDINTLKDLKLQESL